MKKALHYPHYLKAAATVFVLACFFLKPLWAQNSEVLILVNGPWSYVEDPDKPTRVVLIVPYSDHHGPAIIYSGPDAAHYGGKTSFLPGTYNLEINNVKCGDHPSSSAQAYAVPVDVAAVITKVIKDPNYMPNIPRYTISLPKPCYYTSEYARWSKVGKQLTGTQSTKYTVSMALHYQVSPQVTSAIFSGKAADGSITYNNTEIAFKKDNSGKAGISVVMAAPMSGSSRECDSHSREAFENTKLLFNLDLYAQYPKLRSDGSQSSVYSNNPNCTSKAQLGMEMTRMDIAPKLLVQIEQLEAYINQTLDYQDNDPLQTLNSVNDGIKQIWPDKVPDVVKRELEVATNLVAELQNTKTTRGKRASKQKETRDVLEETEQQVVIFSAGSGDCNQSQFDINGAVSLQKIQ